MLVLHNTLQETLHLSWLADNAADAQRLSELLPFHRREFALPSGRGWLVAERLVWRSVLGVGTPTQVVRHGANVSSAITLPREPMPPLGGPDFALLVNAESSAVQICSTPPAPRGQSAAPPRCHGLLRE